MINFTTELVQELLFSSMEIWALQFFARTNLTRHHYQLATVKSLPCASVSLVETTTAN